MFSIGILGFLVWSQKIYLFYYVNNVIFFILGIIATMQKNKSIALLKAIICFIIIIFHMKTRYSCEYVVQCALDNAQNTDVATDVRQQGPAFQGPLGKFAHLAGQALQYGINHFPAADLAFSTGGAMYAKHIFTNTPGPVIVRAAAGSVGFFGGLAAKATYNVLGFGRDPLSSRIISSNRGAINAAYNPQSAGELSMDSSRISGQYPIHSVLEQGDVGYSFFYYVNSLFSPDSFFDTCYIMEFHLFIIVLLTIFIVACSLFLPSLGRKSYNKLSVFKNTLIVFCYVICFFYVLYIFCFFHFSQNMACIGNSVMQVKFNISSNYTILHIVTGVPVESYEKIFTIVIIAILGYYRNYNIISSTCWNGVTKFVIYVVFSVLVHYVISFIMENINVENASKGETLFSLFHTHNQIVTIIIYAIVTMGFFGVISYYFEEWAEWGIEHKPCNRFNVISVQIFSLFIKMIVALCFVVISVAILHLYVHQLPPDIFKIIEHAINIEDKNGVYFPRQNMMAFSCRNAGVINFAICWNSSISWDTLIRSKKAHRWTKSARNFHFTVIKNKVNKSSSETTRKTCFQFDSFHKIHQNFYPSHAPLIDNKWLEWFIGFSEGDGSLLTSIKAKQKRLRFVLTQKEKQVLDHIQSILGFGSVRHVSNGNYYRYIVEDNKNILILSMLFNGNLVIPYRIIQLEKWITALNNSINNSTSYLRVQHKVTELMLFISSPRVFTLSDAWLSGFTDAEGNFIVEVTKRNTSILGHQCSMRFILDQNHSEMILLYIISLFGTGSVYRRKDTTAVYRITIHSIKSMALIYHYFTHFGLKTIKRFSFQKFCVIYNMLARKEHLTVTGLCKIQRLRKLINKNNAWNKPIGKAKVLNYWKHEDIVRTYLQG